MPVLPFGYCHRLRLSVYLCVRRWVFVRAITYHPFQLGSPNLDQRCITSWLRSILFCGMGWVGEFNTLRPRQNGHRYADDIFKRIFLNENARISIKSSLKFVPKGPISNIPALAQIMAWRQSGDKPLSEPMMASLLTHVRVIRPRWVNLQGQI